nr:MAG TPA: minor capsid protein [Caudoviricetes sp.]
MARAGTSPYARAYIDKIRLATEQEKRLKAIYESAAKEVDDLLNNFQLRVSSDAMKKVYYEHLQAQIADVYREVGGKVQQTAIDSGLKSAQLAINCHSNQWCLGDSGVFVAYGGAFNHIPKQAVLGIVTGKVYDKPWSLSSSIWKAGAKTQRDVETIISQGLIQNKSVEDISKAVSKYVRPSKVKDWDWNKVYPGVSRSVEYNSQRLVRTLIQHSFQAAMVSMEKSNPFCQAIQWNSAAIEGRTCEICLDRDGQKFLPKDLPFDHPNGLCWFEPVIDDLDEVANKLARWVNGEQFPEIDNYLADAFGVDVSKFAVPATKKSMPHVPSQATKTAVKNRKSMLKATQPIEDKAAYVDKNFNTLKKRVISNAKHKATGQAIWDELRYEMTKLDSDYLRYMQHGQSKLKGIAWDGRGARYQPGYKIIQVDLRQDLNNIKGKFITFFHEYGHHMDEVFKDGSKSIFTKNSEFKKNVWKLLKEGAEQNIFEAGVEKVKSGVRRELTNDHRSSGVQDLIAGLTKDRERILWGHDAEYWKDDQKRAVCSEFLAHCSEAWARPAQAEYMEKYFPQAYKYFKDTAMENLIKKEV